MKTINDYICKLIAESEGSVNVVSSGAIATKEVPLGKVAKRKDLDESNAYGGDNPLANNIGKFPLISGATAGEADVEIEKGATAEDSDEQKKRMFHLKQQEQNDQISTL